MVALCRCQKSDSHTDNYIGVSLDQRIQWVRLLLRCGPIITFPISRQKRLKSIPSPVCFWPLTCTVQTVFQRCDCEYISRHIIFVHWMDGSKVTLRSYWIFSDKPTPPWWSRCLTAASRPQTTFPNRSLSMNLVHLPLPCLHLQPLGTRHQRLPSTISRE